MIKFDQLMENILHPTSYPTYHQNPATPKTVMNVPKKTEGTPEEINHKIGHLLDINGWVKPEHVPKAEKLIGRIPSHMRRWKYSDEYETISRDSGNPAYIKDQKKFKSPDDLKENTLRPISYPTYHQDPATPKTVMNVPKKAKGTPEEINRKIGHLTDIRGWIKPERARTAEKLIGGRIPSHMRAWKYSDEYETVSRDTGNPAYIKDQNKSKSPDE